MLRPSPRPPRTAPHSPARRAGGGVVGALLVGAALGVVPSGALAQPAWWAPPYGEPLEASAVTDRAAAATALGRENRPGRAGEATQRLVVALEQERHPVVREAIVGALGRLAHPGALEILATELPTTRARELQSVILAIASIGEAGSPQAAAVLVEQLSARGRTDLAREGLRRAGLVALPALLRALRDATQGRTPIAQALGDIRSHQATPGLLQALAGEWEPAEGVAFLEALGAIADPRAREAVRDTLAQGRDPRVQRAALAALAALGVGPGGEEIEALTNAEDAGVARQALATLLEVDPERGARVLTARVAASDPAEVQQAAELALAWRHPLVVPVLFGLVNEGTRADRAISALADLGAGAGVPVLLHVAREDAPHAGGARLGLALALRRWSGVMGGAARRDALEELRREPGQRAWLLRSLAADTHVEPELRAGLASEAGITRKRAAHALFVLGRHASADAARELLLRARVETDTEVFRELAFAHVALGRPCGGEARGLAARLHGADTRDATLLLLSGCADALSPAVRRELAQLGRSQLAAANPSSRALAAWALARAGDAGATRTLLARLEGERDAWVRRAFARAVWTLATPPHAADARGLARIETDSVTAALLRDAGRGPVGARAFPQLGDEILRVQIRPVDPVPEGLPVEIRLPDGRGLRVTTFPDGLLVVPDLPAGVADVEVVPGLPAPAERD